MSNIEISWNKHGMTALDPRATHLLARSKFEHFKQPRGPSKELVDPSDKLGLYVPWLLVAVHKQNRVWQSTMCPISYHIIDFT